MLAFGRTLIYVIAIEIEIEMCLMPAVPTIGHKQQLMATLPVFILTS